MMRIIGCKADGFKTIYCNECLLKELVEECKEFRQINEMKLIEVKE